MQSHAGRDPASDVDMVDDRPSTADSASTGTTKTLEVPYLPPEIHQAIVSGLFQQPCTLRRQVVNKLLEQRHTPDSSLHDKAVRLAATKLMDDAELTVYRSIRNQVSTLSLVSNEYRLHALFAERKWLEAMPMDITAFRRFCATSEAHNVDTIVIGMFTDADFINPPQFINAAASETLERIYPHELELLRDRRSLPYPPPGSVRSPALHLIQAGWSVLDDKVAYALTRLWAQGIKNLPRSVKKVRFINKMPGLGSGNCPSEEQVRMSRAAGIAVAVSDGHLRASRGFMRALQRPEVEFEVVA